jgi:FtsH-binding integral membrane protein
MGRVYGYMAVSVLISMLVSYFVGTSQSLMELFFTGITKWVVIFAPLVMILAYSVMAQRLDKLSAKLFLLVFSAIMGLSFATIFVVYNMGSIVSAFMGASVLFGVMSGYGYFTKKDLSGFYSLLFVGLIAVIVASVINIFLGSTLFQMVISSISILVFLGLTAYDTQQIRQDVSIDNDGVAEVHGALSLYLNFINIFLSLLQLFGEKND